MASLRCYISTIACITILTSSLVCAEEPGMKVTANRDRIYIGESFILEITVSGSGDPAEIDFSGLKNANIRPLGSRNISNYQITIINGRITREGFSGFVSSYEITPLVPGRFQAGPITAKINGKLLAAAGPVVMVTDIEKQDRVILSVTASRETALIDEPFSVTLNFKIQCLPGAAAGFEPLFPDNPPALTIPWLDQELAGLTGPDVRRLLTGCLAPHWNQPGVTINRFTLASDPFDIGSMFLREPRKAKFSLPRKTVQINNRSYCEYSLQFDYVPQEEGNYVFGPVIFKGGVPERLDEHGRAVGADIFAVGPACTVRIIPPPEEGRPESYSGAIGSNLVVKAALDTAECNLGDPLTLTLTASGPVRLDKMFPPKLSLQTNLLERFTIYDNTAQSVKKGTYNQFLYTIRPSQAGRFEIPPIEVAYYDVVGRGYRKIFTDPIPVRVRRGAEVTGAQIIGATNHAGRRGEDAADLRQAAPAPIRLDNAGAAPAGLLGGPRLFLLAGAGPALYFAVVLLGFIRRSGRRIIRVRRVRSAKDRAYRGLRAAARIGQKDLPQAAALVCRTARKYLGERLGGETAALTPAETVRLLSAHGVSENLAGDFGALYEKYFNTGFAGARVAGNMAEDCRGMRGLIKRIEKELDRLGKNKAAGAVVILFLLLGVSAFGLDASDRNFIWEEANAAMQTARTSADYLRAAEIYQRLVDAGVRNGPLFYNMGTALLRAGRDELAVGVFERAERYLGYQPDLEHNLKIASARKTGGNHARLPWQRVVFFWHFYLACPQRSAAAVFAFFLFWLALVLRKAGIGRAINAVALAGLVCFIVFATSAAASWQMENSARRCDLRLPPAAPAELQGQAAAATDNP
ncbi:MAG: BatD family protein [Kiritimatiellae bacterium]|nr:BatD family protein [Kiritimatiellia bacterium]